MVIPFKGDLFADGAFPGAVVISGSKLRSAKTFRYCPYSTQSIDYNGGDTSIPDGDKIYHQETNGRMHTYSLGGVIGWVCASNDCSFYTGTFAATTSGFEVIQQGRDSFYPSGCPKTEEDFATLSGSVLHLNVGRKIIPGTRYFQI